MHSLLCLCLLLHTKTKTITMTKLFRFLLLCWALTALAFQVHATHIRAGDLTIRRLSGENNRLSYEIKVMLYRDVTGVPAGIGNVQITRVGNTSPDHRQDVSPRSLGLTPDGRTEVLEYKLNYTFGSDGRYRISYFERNRNPTIKNISLPEETPFFIESEFLINFGLGFNSSPQLLVPPVVQGNVGQRYIQSLGAYDVDGDSLSFRFTICRQGSNQPVQNYRFPDDKNENWSLEQENCSRPPIFTLDPRTGELIWDAPNERGEYNVALFIDEWRGGIKIGSVNRDMQIIINDLQNVRPKIDIPADTCIVAGTQLAQLITAQDQNQRPCGSNTAQVPIDPVYLSLATKYQFAPPRNTPLYKPVSEGTPDGKASGMLTWQTGCLDVRREPYLFAFEAIDRPNNSLARALSDTKTWRVRVVGPNPTGLQANYDAVTGQVAISWDSYACGQADKIYIYRRSGSFDFQPVCETGLPTYTGYQQVGEVKSDATIFLDRNLQKGANYCYRIYASFPNPSGGESLASAEVCVFIPDRLYMQEVSVLKTDAASGQIGVRWTRPASDAIPAPVSYRLERSQDRNTFSAVTTTTDTAFVDQNLNTELNTYYYRVVALSGGQPADTTATASSVRLQPKGNLTSIQLQWQAQVPWNLTTDRFVHEVYRKRKEQPNSQFQRIGTAETHQQGMRFTDDGQETPLDKNVQYCYYVLTRGSYERPELREPLENLSQIACATLNDTTAPCPPKLAELAPCTPKTRADFLPNDDCLGGSNLVTLDWTPEVAPPCEDDVAYYNVYYSDRKQPDATSFMKQARKLNKQPIAQTSFTHGDPALSDILSPGAGCYAVTAVDTYGNESKPSNIQCRQSCPYYELPNAFTPNGDGFNDLFMPFACPQYVVKVEFQVFNRWGQPVFERNDDIQLRWDGTDKGGKELSSGTYYYLARVTFANIEGGSQVSELKGWVELMRGKNQ